jgi:VWFA-related protein
MVVDDLGLSFESTYHVHRTLKNFIDTQVQPGDLVAVLRTGAGVGALQQFTTDRRLLYAAVDRIRWNMNARVVPFETATSAADAKISAHEAEIFTAGTLGAVRYVLKGVAELPGRKAIVLFSDGFKLTDADNHYGRVLGTLRSLVDAANRAGVVIYSVHAAGLQTGAPSAAEGSPGNPGQRLDMIRAAQDGLAVLAQQTGGLFIHDTNDLAGGVRRVLDDQQGYYLLGYVPDRSTFSESTPRFHSLRVRVRRPDLRVRSRSGFLGQPDTTPKARTVADRMIAAVTSPFAGGEINLRLTSFFGQVDKVGPVVQSYMHIDAKELTFEERADGTRDAQVEVLAVTFGENGEVADQSSRRYTVTLLPDRYAEALKTGFVYTVRVPVKRPGPYQLRIALRDVKSDRIGSTSHFVDVPDVRKGRLTLSGLLIEGARPRSAGGEAADHVEAADPNASVAVRSFRQGADANYACYVYNAKRGPSGRPQLESEVRLFRDGVQVFHSPARPLSPVPDASSAMAGGLLRFGSAFPPGTYVLELTVIDRLAKKNSRATQTIDFEVVP